MFLEYLYHNIPRIKHFTTHSGRGYFYLTSFKRWTGSSKSKLDEGCSESLHVPFIKEFLHLDLKFLGNLVLFDQSGKRGVPVFLILTSHL